MQMAFLDVEDSNVGNTVFNVRARFKNAIRDRSFWKNKLDQGFYREASVLWIAEHVMEPRRNKRVRSSINLPAQLSQLVRFVQQLHDPFLLRQRRNRQFQTLNVVSINRGESATNAASSNVYLESLQVVTNVSLITLL